MNFEEQLQTRIDNNQKVLDHAYSDLACVVRKDSKGFLPLGEEALEENTLKEVFTALGVKMPDIPGEITELNARLEYIQRATGIMRRRVELKDRWWRETTGPLLGGTEDGILLAILPDFPTGYEFYDIDEGKRVRVNAKTSRKIGTDAFCFYRTLPAQSLGLADLGLYMLKSISRVDIAMLLTATLLISLLGMFTPFMNKQIFDSVIPSGTKSDVFPVAGLLIGAAIGSAFFGISRNLLLNRFRDKINMSVQSAAMARIFSLPAVFFKQFSAGELASRAMSINQLCSMLTDTTLTTGLSVLFSFVYIFQMAGYASCLVAPGLLIIFTMLAFTIITGFIQLGISQQQMKVSAHMNGLVFGLLNGVQKIKLAGAEERAFAKWASGYREQGQLTYSPPPFLKINSAISGMLTLSGTILLYYLAGMNKVALSDFIAFNTAYGAVTGAIMALSGVVMTFANIRPLMEMVNPILKAVPETDESKKPTVSISGDIEMSNVTFRYYEAGPVILDNISLNIKRGEYVAIVGKTGCGKSTLMRLLLGFEKPGSGAVYYDGQDLKSLDVRSIRQHMGVVLQNGKLFAGDIFSNIIIAAPWSTLDDAWEAARVAGMEEDIKAMPMGMHTIISEGSGGISGGQRQRLLIARAICSKPKILFFDEATSALDNITQKHVADSLAGLGCTRLVIAHRLSTVINCDRILVMDRGRIVEEGTFDELMEKQALFYEFAQRQTA